MVTQPDLKSVLWGRSHLILRNKLSFLSSTCSVTFSGASGFTVEQTEEPSDSTATLHQCFIGLVLCSSLTLTHRDMWYRHVFSLFLQSCIASTKHWISHWNWLKKKRQICELRPKTSLTPAINQFCHILLTFTLMPHACLSSFPILAH